MSTFVIRPNTFYHSREYKWLLATLMAITLGIAIRFALLGYWPILPFAVMDISILLGIFIIIRRQSDYLEIVSIDSGKLSIEHLQKDKNQQWRFPLYWTQVKLIKSDNLWYPSKLIIGSHGQWVELGQCMTNEERESLANTLRSRIKEYLVKP